MGGVRIPGPICEVRNWFGETAVDVVGLQACGFVDSPLEFTVAPTANAFDRLRVGATRADVSAGRALTAYAWPYGEPTAAVEHEIRLDGHTVVVVRPDATSAAAQGLPTVEQVAAALRAIPSPQRRRTKTARLCPWPSPDSRPGKTVAGEGGADDITLFPLPHRQSQVEVDTRVMHESGHNVQAGIWGSAADVQAWRDVAQADARSPSRYAKTGTGEDFCEFYVIYLTTKDTPCETMARQLYPKRWQTMAAYLRRP